MVQLYSDGPEQLDIEVRVDPMMRICMNSLGLELRLNLILLLDKVIEALKAGLIQHEGHGCLWCTSHVQDWSKDQIE